MKLTLISSLLLVAPAASFTVSHKNVNRGTIVLNEKDELHMSAVETEIPSSLQTRKIFLNAAAVSASLLISQAAGAEDTEASSRPESLDINNFLRTGQEAFPMGVSSQAGKSKPVTGVFLRDGTTVERDSRSGNVLAEIVLGDKEDLSAVLVSFTSPWPLAKGTVFDVECRDSKTGDGAFLSVTESTKGQSLKDIPTQFFLDTLFAPTGRFSFYGSPTNLKVKSSEIVDNKRIIQFSFANLSQSTNAEIPRTGVMVATKPDNTDQAIMLVSSATTNRWRKGSDKAAIETISSFSASGSPKSSLKVRRRQKYSDIF